jgi:hypothetical protein
MLAKTREPHGARSRRWLDQGEADTILTAAQELTRALLAALASGQATMRKPLPAAALAHIDQAANFSPDQSRIDQQHFHRIYQPVGILPPDQYLSLVLQIAEGCSFNTCTFCDFYKARPFHIKTVAELRAHAQAVRDFLGAGLSLRRGIFLGDANALVIPMHKLLPLLDVIHETYDVAALGGLFAFLDGFSGQKKSPADYATLAERGLRRVYIGMESGSAELLKFLRKPGTPQHVIEAVQAIKAGGVAVSVIILLGAGGEQYAADHVQATIDALNAMPLDQHDLLYFSELVVSDSLAYAATAAQAQLQILDHAAMQQQEASIRAGLRFPSGTPQISRYDIREFVY